MVTLIIAFFIINSNCSLEFIRYETVLTNSMKECRSIGDDYPIPKDVDALTYICVENKWNDWR